MKKHNFLNELGQLISELPAAERLACAKRRAEKSNTETTNVVGTQAYWYIRW